MSWAMVQCQTPHNFCIYYYCLQNIASFTLSIVILSACIQASLKENVSLVGLLWKTNYDKYESFFRVVIHLAISLSTSGNHVFW